MGLKPRLNENIINVFAVLPPDGNEYKNYIPIIGETLDEQVFRPLSIF